MSRPPGQEPAKFPAPDESASGWFTTYQGAVERGDARMARIAHDRLVSLGYDFQHTFPRPTGGRR